MNHKFHAVDAINDQKGSGLSNNDMQQLVASDVIFDLVHHFHTLIRELTRTSPDIVAWLPGHLPGAKELVAATSSNPGYLNPPGMHGGFKFRLSSAIDGLELIVDSWNRVIHGSDQTHVVAQSGWRLTHRSDDEDDSLHIVSPKDIGTPLVSVLCWNVNNRVGRTRFRPEAAQAAMETGADVLVFNEFYPGREMSSFRATLEQRGWMHQTLSFAPGDLKANRILIASRYPHQIVALPTSTLDEHLTSNALCVDFSDFRLFAIRVPTYKGADRARAWDWVASAVESINCAGRPAILCGDLNTSMTASGASRVPQFHSLVESDAWRRVQPDGRGSFFRNGAAPVEIDHVLANTGCVVAGTSYLTDAGPYVLAGSEAAISDHAALIFTATSLDQVRKSVQACNRVQ